MNNPVILSVTAHPDDEVLGFGASAVKWSKKGYKIVNCILSGEADARTFRPELEELKKQTAEAQRIMNCEPPVLYTLPNIKFNTIPHLEIVQLIEEVIQQIKPDFVFTHHPNDLNNDHYHTSIACQAAIRLFQRKPVKAIKGFFFMEILSSTDWAFPVGNNIFNPNTFVEVGEKNIEIKLKALAAYKGVMRPFPHPRSREVVKGLAAYRGGQAGMQYAESFQCVFQCDNI